MKTQLADITTNEKLKLNGFKVLGFLPFYLTYITTETHIRLCKIKEQIQTEHKEKTIELQHFYNTELMKKLQPLINKYIEVALLNGRFFISFFVRPFLRYKIKRCSHSQLFNLFITIQKLNEPAFFLSYCQILIQKDNTLYKEVIPS